VGIGGMVATGGAGAQEHDTGTTTTTAAPTTSAGPSNPNTFDLSALANSLDAVITDPSLPLSGDLAYEAGPWGASATVNSLGESMSDAGAPYSPSVADLPGTVNGIGAGNFPPLPPIPGYVAASYPAKQNNTQTQGGYQISSTAAQSDAKGSVSLGVQAAGSPNPTMFATAETKANGDGSVSATASAGMDVLDFGQLLDLANVSSSITLTQQASQQPKITSQTNLGTVTLLGTGSGVNQAGVAALGINVPIDLNGEIISALNTALAQTGIKFTYLPETFSYTDGTSSTGSTPDSAKTLESVDSGALQVSETQNLPSQGVVTVSMTLGRVYVSTTDVPGPVFGNTGTVGNTGAPITGNSGTGTVAPVGNSGSFPSTSATPATTAGAPASSTTPTTIAVAAAPAYAVEQGPPIDSAYLVLILSAIALLLVVQAVRYLAVRLALSGRPEGT
jgi:hypothetical protein